MKWIVSLVVIQLVIISLQVYRISNLEERVEAMARPPVERSSTNPLQPAAPTPGLGQVPSTLDEQSLRRIVRSELRALRSSDTASPPGPESPEQLIEPVENAYRLDAVKEELSYHIEQGEISENDMRNLQTEIARLDPDSRTIMLRELVAALNSGDLKGQL